MVHGKGGDDCPGSRQVCETICIPQEERKKEEKETVRAGRHERKAKDGLKAEVGVGRNWNNQHTLRQRSGFFLS